MTKRDRTPFTLGEKVVLRHDAARTVYTVLWSSKNDTDRREQMIATERNSYTHPSTDADLYERAQ